MERGELSIFATRSGRPLAERVVSEFNKLVTARRETLENAVAAQGLSRLEKKELARLNMHYPGALTLGNSLTVPFDEGEMKVELHESVREKDAVLIQSPYVPPKNDDDWLAARFQFSDNIAEGIIFCDALAGCNAEQVTLVSPYLPYARQDYARQRESLTAATYAKLLHSVNVGAVITIEVHSRQNELAYRALNMGFDNLLPSCFFLQAIRAEYNLPERHRDEEYISPNLACVSPDVGGLKRVHHYAKRLGASVGIADKSRDYSRVSKVDAMSIFGDIEGKEKILIDDMIASGGTAGIAIKELYKKDRVPVTVVIAHALFTKNAVPLFDELHSEGMLRKVITTDSIMRPATFHEEHPWYHEVSCAPTLARTIYSMNMSLPVSDIHEEDKRTQF